MNRDDLLKMLDLSGKEDAVPTDDELIPPEQVAKSDASVTALQLDEWALRRGRQLLEESDKLRGLALDELSMADFHAAAFEPDPVLHGACDDPRRLDFLTQLLETPDYKSLHTTTMLNDLASTIAATSFAEQYAQLKKEGRPETSVEVQEMATLRAVGKALTKAEEEVGEAKESMAAMGMGPGSPGSNDPKAIAEVYRRVRNDPTLRRICALAGKYRRVAQSRQR